MNRHFPYDQILILVVLALVGFGLVVVFSASSLISQELYRSTTAIFTRQFLSTVLGLIALLAVMRIDYHIYNRPLFAYGLLAFTLTLLVLVLLIPGINGARRWISLGPVNFQPSELAKLTVVFFTAFFLVRREGWIEHLKMPSLLPLLGVLASLLLLVLLAPDLGTAVCLGLIAGLLLFFGGLPYRYCLGVLLATVPLFYLLVLSVPYRRNRILAFLDPSQDPYGIGYQIRQSLIAVGSGGITGTGLAHGKQKLFFLPEPHTDFIFAVVGEELGLLGCATLLLLFSLLFWRGVRIALRADSLFGTFVALGLVSMIVFQAFINMSVVLSLFPTKGLPLPFISAGGSSMFVMLVAVGVLLNISRHARGRGSTEWTAEEGGA